MVLTAPRRFANNKAQTALITDLRGLPFKGIKSIAQHVSLIVQHLKIKKNVCEVPAVMAQWVRRSAAQHKYTALTPAAVAVVLMEVKSENVHALKFQCTLKSPGRFILSHRPPQLCSS